MVNTRCSARSEVDKALARIAERDGQVHAFTYVAGDEALERADRLDAETARGHSRSELHGVPIGVKEIVEVAGWPHTAGSLAWEGRVGEKDATLITRLREAGAIPIGLTRSHEFAWGVTTQHETRGGTDNPAAPGHVPGGSSGGSGAAVAAGMLPLAVGTDTGGSVRIPAALCGVFGIRPSMDVIPTGGVVPLAPSFDVPGFLSPTSALSIAAMRLFGVELDGTRHDLRGLTIGVAPAADPPTSVAQWAAVRSVAGDCERMGATLREVGLPPAAEVFQCFVGIQQSEAFALHSGVLGTWPEKAELLSRDLRALVESAAGADATWARARQAELQTWFTDLDVDLILAPSVGCGPSGVDSPEVLDGRFRIAALMHTVLQPILGAPAASIPEGVDENGFPVGVQLFAHPGHDALVLEVCRLLSGDDKGAARR